MKHYSWVTLFALLLFISCNKKIYPTNGETIYRTGKNKQGIELLDKGASQITIFKSCQSCHGKKGNRTNNCVIKYAALTNPNLHSVPYTDSLFFRFLDDDLKSDGTKPNTGVIWKMSDQDKKDLIGFLKTL